MLKPVVIEADCCALPEFYVGTLSGPGLHYNDAKPLSRHLSSKGNCLENAAMESFFSILKSELFHLKEFDCAAIKKDIVKL
jgi:transposase InsO family protein